MPSGVYSRKLVPLLERIRRRIKISPGGCWLWSGAIAPNGYGSLGIGQRSLSAARKIYAHRLSYELHVGAIPEGLDLDHLCRVRHCVNPSHLEPVTRQENVRRGVGSNVGDYNGKKSHCVNGHAFDKVNTYLRPTGGRSCRACLRARRIRKHVSAD